MTQEQATKRRWYGHPFVIGALMMFLFVDLLSIPNKPGQISTVQRRIVSEESRYGWRSWRSVAGTAERTGISMRWHWAGTPEYFDANTDPNNDDLSRVFIFQDFTKETGFYHLTRRTEQFYVRSQGLSDEDEGAMLQAILVAIDEDANRALKYAVVADMIRSGVRKKTYPIDAGPWRNTLASLAALAFVACCARGKPWQWFREPRLGFYSKYSLVERRRMRNQCVSCGYDLAGLASGVCPECGYERQEPGEATQ